MNRHGRAAGKPFAGTGHHAHCVYERGHRIRTRDVDNGRRPRHRTCEHRRLLAGQFKRHPHIGRHFLHVSPERNQLVAQPLTPRLTSGNQHSSRHALLFNERKKRFAARMFRIALGINDFHVISPSSADDFCRPFAHGRKRDVFRPLAHPVRHGRNGRGRGHHHHFHIVKMRETFGDERLIFGERNRKGGPAPDSKTVGLQKVGETVVGSARTRQNNRAISVLHK